jgi:hypothetical protein
LKPKPTVGVSRAVLSLQAFQKFRTTIVSNMFDGVVGVRLGLYDNCNLLAAIPKVDGFYSLYLPHEVAVRTRVYRSETEVHERLADFMAVSHTTKPGTFWDWMPRSSCSPMITAGQLPVYLDQSKVLNELLNPDFDGRRVVFLDSETKATVESRLATNVMTQVTQFSAHHITVDYDAPDYAMIVVAQADYHRWKAYVNDTNLPILRANHAFQAIQVPPGKHTLVLKYEDTPFKLGLFISVLSFAGGMTGLFRWKRQACSPAFNLSAKPQFA